MAKRNRNISKKGNRGKRVNVRSMMDTGRYEAYEQPKVINEIYQETFDPKELGKIITDNLNREKVSEVISKTAERTNKVMEASAKVTKENLNKISMYLKLVGEGAKENAVAFNAMVQDRKREREERRRNQPKQQTTTENVQNNSGRGAKNQRGGKLFESEKERQNKEKEYVDSINNRLNELLQAKRSRDRDGKIAKFTKEEQFEYSELKRRLREGYAYGDFSNDEESKSKKKGKVGESDKEKEEKKRSNLLLRSIGFLTKGNKKGFDSVSKSMVKMSTGTLSFLAKIATSLVGVVFFADIVKTSLDNLSRMYYENYNEFTKKFGRYSGIMESIATGYTSLKDALTGKSSDSIFSQYNDKGFFGFLYQFGKDLTKTALDLISVAINHMIDTIEYGIRSIIPGMGMSKEDIKGRRLQQQFADGTISSREINDLVEYNKGVRLDAMGEYLYSSRNHKEKLFGQMGSNYRLDGTENDSIYAFDYTNTTDVKRAKDRLWDVARSEVGSKMLSTVGMKLGDLKSEEGMLQFRNIMVTFMDQMNMVSAKNPDLELFGKNSYYGNDEEARLKALSEAFVEMNGMGIFDSDTLTLRSRALLNNISGLKGTPNEYTLHELQKHLMSMEKTGLNNLSATDRELYGKLSEYESHIKTNLDSQNKSYRNLRLNPEMADVDMQSLNRLENGTNTSKEMLKTSKEMLNEIKEMGALGGGISVSNNNVNKQILQAPLSQIEKRGQFTRIED